MRFVVVILIALLGAEARADDIVDVLQRSQQIRLDALVAADPDSAKARIVRSSFGRLMQSEAFEAPVELRVVRGAVLAETLQGRVVVANESLADLPEATRRFILAHELGHEKLGHWTEMGRVFRKWVPGAVTPSQTDPVAGRLGRDASALAHRQEFEADAFAARTLWALGGTPADLLAVFMQLGAQGETATHPSVRKRVAALRQLDLPPSPDRFAAAPAETLVKP